MLSFEGSDKNSKEYQLFAAKHPDVAIETETNIVLSTTELVYALLNGEFDYDSFVMVSSSFDIRQMIAKGYCADMTNSVYLLQEIRKMHTPIQEIVMHDSKLYGAPFFCYIGYYAYNPEAWEAAGLQQEDVPKSFEELLDFLESWIERLKNEEIDDICICNTFDSDYYNETSYVSYLVDRLINHYVMQCDYANEPVRFNNEVFCNLLERCQQIGKDLYRYEPVEKSDLALFEDVYGMRNLAYYVPLRITAEQPPLIKAMLYVTFTNSMSHEKTLTMEYIEDRIKCIEPEKSAYLYQNAQPVEDPNYVQRMNGVQQQIEMLEAKLMEENIDLDTQARLEVQLENAKDTYVQMEESEERYLISENDLKLYQTYGPYLYFQAPSIFDPATEDGQNMRELRNRFSAGLLPLEQFVKRIDQLAYMFEVERE